MKKQAAIVEDTRAGIIPPTMMKTLQKGAEALFYTAAQVPRSRISGTIVKKALADGDFETALAQSMEQGMKRHVADGMPLKMPMVVGATHFVAMYLGKLAADWGFEFSAEQIKEAAASYTQDVMRRFASMEDEPASEISQPQPEQLPRGLMDEALPAEAMEPREGEMQEMQPHGEAPISGGLIDDEMAQAGGM